MTKDSILRQAPNPDLRSAMFEVGLRSSAIRAKRARLREPCAWDELLAENAGPGQITELIANLLVCGTPGWLSREEVGSLSLSDRDRIVAALHRHCFGDRLESIVTCCACQEPFEIGLSLAELVDSVGNSAAAAGIEAPNGDGYYVLASGARFRLPTIEDELAITTLPVNEAAGALLARCSASVDHEGEGAALEGAMESLAPLVDVDIPVACAHCAAEQPVHFEMVSFFLSTLARERPILLREIHRIASAYHWSSHEIMALPRSLRRAHVALVEVDRGSLRAAS
jgi:hypothetical protein